MAGSSEMEYYFTVDEPANFAGPDGQNTAVRDLVGRVVSNREYHMGLGRHSSGQEWEHRTLHTGDAFSMVVEPTPWSPHYDYPTDSNRGSLTVAGPSAILDVPVAEPEQGASGLRLSCHMDVKTAQEMIDEVRLPKWQNNVSTQTMTVTWTLTGILNGKGIEVNFDQTLTARSYTYGFA